MKILALTSIRSDYDLMTPLYRLLHDSENIELKLLVSGAHLSPTFGYTVKDIETDGFDILLKLETLLDSDSKVARLKSAAFLMSGIIDIVDQFQADLIIYAGDREDTLIGAMLGAYLLIPTIHFYAGDHACDGYVDNPVRHAASKLSSLMFVSADEHKKRLLSIGETENRIHTIGSIALDKFMNQKALCKSEILQKIGQKDLSVDYAILIFHPISMEQDCATEYLENMIKALIKNKITPCVSYPNSDSGNRRLIDVLKLYASRNEVILYGNLPREHFVSLFKHATFIIGNSSAGILEAASIPLPAINVGLRQLGRLHGENVQFCDGTLQSIDAAIKVAMSKEYLARIDDIKNIYGDGDSAQKAFDLINQLNLGEYLQKPEDPLECSSSGAKL